jgi:Pyruvate/2-oxoacid:ferredoxin oxidoreductase delta subunit
MENGKLYEDLAAHLDQGVIGSPKSPSLIEILKILFPDEEAEIAVRLPLENKSLPELQELFPERADALGETLGRMAKRGTVYTDERPGKGRRYRLLPSVVGWAETPYWAGTDSEDGRKLAPLWLKYREEAFGQELARGGTPVVRVVPVSESLKDSSEVLPFDALKPMIEQTSYRAAGHCPCRQMKAHVGEGCDHSLQNCLHFGDMARYMVEQEMAREISVDETLEILADANEEGLVHVADNMEGHLGTICNCCGCCCVFLDTRKQQGLQTFAPSNYVAQVDSATCVACGTCEERCPMDAVAVNGGDFAAVNEDVCIGCGVCTPTCPTDAVDLALRGEVKRPPEVAEFLAARYKALE